MTEDFDNKNKPMIIGETENNLSVEQQFIEQANDSCNRSNRECNNYCEETVVNDINNSKKLNLNIGNKTIVLIAVCIATILIISVILGVVYYNNLKSQQQVAMSRINSICDEINSLEVDTESGKLSIYDSKISEMDNLLKAHKLDDIYNQRCQEAKNYISDLKVYARIEEAFLSVEAESWGKENDALWKNIQNNINILKTERVQAKIDNYKIERIRAAAENWLIFNTLKYFEKNVIEKEKFDSSITGISTSYCISIPSWIESDKAFFKSVPDDYRCEATAVSFGAISRINHEFLDIYWNGMELYNETLRGVEMKEALEKDASRVFVVEYTNNQLEDMYRYFAFDFEVKASYEKGILKLTLNSEDGSEDIRFYNLENKKLFQFGESIVTITP